MATGNLYVCIKPYAVGEVMSSPADDAEHWALYLPRPEKGESGARGYSFRRVNTSLDTSSTKVDRYYFDPTDEGIQIGDSFVDNNGLVFEVRDLTSNEATIYYRTSIKGEAGLGDSKEWIVKCTDGIAGKEGQIAHMSLISSFGQYEDTLKVGALVYCPYGSISVVESINGDNVDVRIIKENSDDFIKPLRAKAKYHGSGTILNVPAASASDNIIGYEIRCQTTLNLSTDINKQFVNMTITKSIMNKDYVWLIEAIRADPSSMTVSEVFYKNYTRNSFYVGMQNSGFGYTIITKRGEIELT